MLNRIVLVVILVPLAIVLVALAVANRAPAAFTIDPFNPGNPALTLTLPLFIMLFLALLLGLVIGSFATWAKQGRYRRLARDQRREMQSLLSEQDRRRAARPVAPAADPARGLPAPLA